MEIGFIGLGLMGRPMARHLMYAGHQLHVWARREENLAPFRETTAQIHVSPSHLAQAVEIVFTMVADAVDVEEVTLGPQGLIHGAKPGLVIVDMSTIAPTAAQEIARRLDTASVEFLDAPVSGGESGAISATLTIMVGGKPAIFEQALPLLNLLGKAITFFGPAGAGQVAKACNQILTGVGVVALAETFHFASRNGVDVAKMRDALLGGMAASRILEQHGARMVKREFRPGFKSWMHQKDLNIVMREAHRLHLQLPAAAIASQMFNALFGAGLGDDDSIAVIQLYEEMCRKNNGQQVSVM